MAFLNRESLLKKSVLKIEKVELGNGDFVYVREMTASERDDYELSLINNKDKSGESGIAKDFRARFCVNCICNESGKLILKESDAESFSASISSSKMKAIFDKAKSINNILENEVLEQEKN